MSWIENGIWLKLKTKICSHFDILKNKNSVEILGPNSSLQNRLVR